MSGFDPSDWETRHEATRQLLRWFDHEHLAPGKPKDLSQWCLMTAELMVKSLDDGPELTAGLRKLLEAKDCFVRAAIGEI